MFFIINILVGQLKLDCSTIVYTIVSSSYAYCGHLFLSTLFHPHDTMWSFYVWNKYGLLSARKNEQKF